MKGLVSAKLYEDALVGLETQRDALTDFSRTVKSLAEDFKVKRLAAEATRDLKLASAVKNDLVYITNFSASYLAVSEQVEFSIGIHNDCELIRAATKLDFDARIRTLQEQALAEYNDVGQGNLNRVKFGLQVQ